jgi:hypothetical protein
MKTLDDSCEEYLNRILHVETHYGCGWSYPGKTQNYVTNEEMVPIKSFDFRLIGFIQNKDKLRIGGIGIIEDEQCQFNGKKIEFTTRHSGMYNFNKDYPECNIILINKNGKDNILGWGQVKAKIV